jgi:methionine aminotransferase
MQEFSRPVPSKLPHVGTTIFTVMSRLAAEHHAINLSQGFPDFNCAPRLVDLVTQHMKAGHNQYPPMAGEASLRDAIAEKVEQLYGARYDPEHEITVTAGATQAIFTAIMAVAGHGDEVLVFEPAYDSYVPAIELAGATPVYVSLAYPDFRIDFDALEQSITPRTRVIMINSPTNPTGTVFPAEDLRRLEQRLAGSGIIVISDEVYEHIVFDGEQHQSAARFPELADRSFIVSSFGKTYHVTGWKIGYCLAPRALMAEFRKVHQFNVFTCNTPVQLALGEFLHDREQYLQLAAFYEKKRDCFRDAIAASRFELQPCRGTYFQCVRYDAITDEPDADFALRLTRENGVAAIPVSAFYREPPPHRILRFCFAKSEDTLARGADILCRI